MVDGALQELYRRALAWKDACEAEQAYNTRCDTDSHYIENATSQQRLKLKRDHAELVLVEMIESLQSAEQSAVEETHALSPAVTIIINGKKYTLMRSMLVVSHQNILDLAFDNPPRKSATITYSKGVNGAQGKLTHGERVSVQDGMIFRAVVTGGSLA